MYSTIGRVVETFFVLVLLVVFFGLLAVVAPVLSLFGVSAQTSGAFVAGFVVVGFWVVGLWVLFGRRG